MSFSAPVVARSTVADSIRMTLSALIWRWNLRALWRKRLAFGRAGLHIVSINYLSHILTRGLNLPWGRWFNLGLLELGVKSTICSTRNSGLWLEIFKGRWYSRILKEFAVVRASDDLQIEIFHLVAREFLAILFNFSNLRL
jgi:hypothetical protein